MNGLRIINHVFRHIWHIILTKFAFYSNLSIFVSLFSCLFMEKEVA